ncbi:MAG TPA: M48 family metallopeptidase [Candidatus Rifleibacterium sp.]|nr:M48 family metallopeptidase [Candidatus Rifleibacterium sp.]HPT46738.1 M48 family metallopeptidase [Candidatus Rifleibacterium sp.]
MSNRKPMLVLVLCLLFQAAFVGQAYALNIGGFLDEVSGALNRVTASLDSTFGGVTADNQKVVEQSRAQAPQTSAFLGKWEDSWETSMGAKTHESLKSDPGFSKDKAMLSRVGTVANRLIKHVERKDLTWHFAVLNTDEVNAFAAPGGYIYVTRGLLNMCKDDNELAGVIAHEMGHIDKKHSVRQAEKSGLMTALVLGLGLSKKTKDAAPFAAIAAYFANLKFSRNDEYQADACAVKYTAAAGYNPNGIIGFFDKINKDNKASKITKYFSTHPPTTDRINAVKKEIARLPGRNNAASNSQSPSSASDSGSSPVAGSQTANSSGSTPATTSPASGSKPSNNDIKLAYESYIYYQQVYQYKVQQQAPMDEVMAAFKQYQAAKKHYMDLRKAAGL